MTTVRTLPIRVPPVAGEALDSWLEALAHRSATAFGDLLVAVGLNPHHGTATNGWIVALTSEQASAITAATAVSRDALTTMTLAHYAGRAVNIHPEKPTLQRGFPWGNARGSRYCPTCLTDNGGRWQLSWRLGWSFACTEHHRLLVDACPRCGAVPRRRTHVGDLIPNIGCCAHRARQANGRIPARCDADLTAAEAALLGPDHPAIRAQHVVNTILDHPTAALGVYRLSPQPRINVLADIRAIAGRALSYGTAEDLQAIIPADLLAAYHQARSNADAQADIAPTPTKPGLAAPAQAATAAVGVLAALHALDKSTIAAGGDALRWLVTTSRQRGLQVSATNIGWGKNTTAVLTGIQLAALGPLLKPSDQLRYRIGSGLPAYPTAAMSSIAPRRIPTMLWPAWSLRLSIPHCHQWQLRPALSAVLLLVNSRLTLDDATRLIDGPLKGQEISRVLGLLEQHDQWHNIRSALIRMEDYLADNEIPIDYQRRRRTDYTTLLPDKVWAQICRDTATPGPGGARARVARCFLFERLSGLPGPTAPWALDDCAFRTKTADFPRYLTPELAQALNTHADEFLVGRGIEDEPGIWQPPAEVLDGLELPGPDPAAVEIPELHRVIGIDKIKLGAAAATRLNTSLDTLRYLLASHPAPKPVPKPSTPLPTPYNRAYVNAKAAIPRECLANLYERKRMSLKDIASTVGVSRATIARLARDYALSIREPGGQAHTTVDRDWLYEQYVNKRQTLPDLAAEAGMSAANMARWAKKHAIPMRSRGGPSHRATLRAQCAIADAPELIRPALAVMGGWNRMQRFAAAVQHPTLTAAAQTIGVNQITLVNQVSRIGHDLGMKLLRRAERGRPMELTEDGRRVLTALREYDRRAPHK